jgi:hypothetical protein
MTAVDHVPDPFVPVMGNERGSKRPPDPTARLDIIISGLPAFDGAPFDASSRAITEEISKMGEALSWSADLLEHLINGGWKVAPPSTRDSADAGASIVVSARKRFVSAQAAADEVRQWLWRQGDLKAIYMLGWNEDPNFKGPDKDACESWTQLLV